MSHILQISAGTGPIEVRRFVALLARHLEARCADLGAQPAETVVHGDEDAPFSVELHLAAAPAEVVALTGTHALVARSADRGRRSRKRWFACVSLGPDEPLPRGAPAIARDDLTITTMRAGGPGGQHVNTTSSAVRVVHKPTGVTVRVADERSQRDNLRAAIDRIARVVAERAKDKHAGARAERRLAHYRLTRGLAAFTYEIDRDGDLRPQPDR